MNKKLNVKQYITMSIIFAAVFAIYNIIVLLLFGDKNNIFWISYGFMCAAFAVDIGVTVFSFKTLDTEAVFISRSAIIRDFCSLLFMALSSITVGFLKRSSRGVVWIVS